METEKYKVNTDPYPSLFSGPQPIQFAAIGGEIEPALRILRERTDAFPE